MPFAERGAAFADEGDRHAAAILPAANAIAMPATVSDEIASGADAGRIPQAKSPTCRSFPSIGGPALPICAFRTMRTVSRVRPHRQRRPQVSDERRDDVALPRPVRAAKRVAAPQADGRGVDRLLAERAEPLALEGDAARTAPRRRRRTPSAGCRPRASGSSRAGSRAAPRASATRRSPRGAGTRRTPRGARRARCREPLRRGDARRRLGDVPGRPAVESRSRAAASGPAEPSIARPSRPGSRRQIARKASRAGASANGYRSATNAANRAARPVPRAPGVSRTRSGAAAPGSMERVIRRC